MEKSTKKKILIIGSILVIGGVVGFVLWKKSKNKKEAERKKKEEEEAAAQQSQSTSTNSGSGTSTSSSYTFPFKSTDEGNKFRAWVNQKYPAYAKEISLDPTGGLNAYLQKAWDKYGAEYNNVLAGNPQGYDQGYMDSWTAAQKSGTATFVWLGKTYDTKTGKATTVAPSGTSAIGQVAYPKGNNTKVRSEARAADGMFDNTFVGLINSPNKIGKIKNSTKGQDGYLWYEVDLSTPPMAVGGIGNPYAKVGWVREDVVSIKSA